MIRTRTPHAAAPLRLAAATLVVLLAVLVVTEAGAQSGYSLTQEWGSVGVEDGLRPRVFEARVADAQRHDAGRRVVGGDGLHARERRDGVAGAGSQPGSGPRISV